jgi:hypothetical protein
MVKEPCVVCGEETGIGSPYYSSRRAVVSKGAEAFLCSDCEARSHPGRRHELTDEQRRKLDESALMFGLGYEQRR